MLTNDILLSFFNKEPESNKEWNENSEQLQVAMAFFAKELTTCVRNGVLLGISDAFGKR